MRYQVDTEEESKDPQSRHWKSRQDHEAGQYAEYAGQQHDPARLSPMADTKQDADEPGNQQHQAEDVGENQRAGDRLAHQHGAKGDVQDTEQQLPDEPAPTLGPERVDDLESAREDGHPAD